MAEVHFTMRQGPAANVPTPARISDSTAAGSGRAGRVDAKPDLIGSQAPWDERMMHRLVSELKGYLYDIEGDIKVPSEFLAALTANESGGDPRATRFEPGVYQHLKSVAEGRVASYGSIVKSLLEKEIQRESASVQAAAHHGETQPTGQPLPSSQTAHASAPPGPGSGSPGHSETGGTAGAAAAAGTSAETQAGTHAGTQPTTAKDPESDEHQASPAAGKAESYHAEHLTAAFAAASAPVLTALEDGAIRHLATSWGLTQIMGYHMLGRPEPVEKLCDPAFHYRVAARMVEEFAARFHLDPQRDFEALFHCWNTGRPDGKTYDPSYVQKGMRRIEICRQLLSEPAQG